MHPGGFRIKHMDELKLIPPSAAYAPLIEEYRAEFPKDRMQVTHVPDRIPGLDRLEEYGGVDGWLGLCDEMRGRISWYLCVRVKDGRLVGCFCVRHSLEYDDDDIEFASHIGYSVRPSERGMGYGREILRLALEKAKEAGIKTVRLVCRDSNAASNRIIRQSGGIFVDSIYGEESGLTVNRYDISAG